MSEHPKGADSIVAINAATAGSNDTPVGGDTVVTVLTDEVGSWPGVEMGEHRFGGVEFHIGRREIGHVHAGRLGGSFADLPFPRKIRDELIEAGRAREHHALPNSGWLTVPIRTHADLRAVVDIFRMNYERTSPSPR
jgi:hypothetical protein